MERQDTAGPGDDALAADDALLQALDAVTEDERAGLRFSMGPMSLGFNDLFGLRLNEHAFHTWDIAVALDDDGRRARGRVAVIVDNLSLIARFSGRSDGQDRTIASAPPIPCVTWCCACRTRGGADGRGARPVTRSRTVRRGAEPVGVRPARRGPHARRDGRCRTAGDPTGCLPRPVGTRLGP